MTDEKDRKESLREHLEDDDHQDLRERMEEVAGNVKRPPRNDPRHADDSVRPGGRDVPAGGSSGESMGGSANKRKGQSG